MRSTRGLKAQAVFERYYTELGEYIEDRGTARPSKQPGIPNWSYLTKAGSWRKQTGSGYLPNGSVQQPEFQLQQPQPSEPQPQIRAQARRPGLKKNVEKTKARFFYPFLVTRFLCSP